MIKLSLKGKPLLSDREKFGEQDGKWLKRRFKEEVIFDRKVGILLLFGMGLAIRESLTSFTGHPFDFETLGATRLLYFART